MTPRLGIAAVALHLAILGAPWVAPYPPLQQHRHRAAAAPSATFLLGTDDLGRDVASRMLFGARISLGAAAVSTVLVVILAAVIGGGAALGRWADAGLTALTECTMGVPWVFLLLAVRGVLPLDLPPGVAFLAVASIVGAVSWGATARLCRGAVLHALAQPYALAARAAGATAGRILAVHAAPAMRPMLVAQALILFPQFVLAEVGLSFLGLGVSEPWPSLGTLLGEARTMRVLAEQPWRLAPAGLLVLLLLTYRALGRRYTRHSGH